jgi:hypothetical protein
MHDYDIRTAGFCPPCQFSDLRRGDMGNFDPAQEPDPEKFCRLLYEGECGQDRFCIRVIDMIGNRNSRIPGNRHPPYELDGEHLPV